MRESEVLERLGAAAARVAPLWGLGPAARLRPLALSENATFLAEDPGRERPIVLRVHRAGYHDIDEIRSEHAWIEALREAGIVATPAPLDRLDGHRLARIDDADGVRHVAAFAYMAGTEPRAGGALASGFERLGAISARLHAHARSWTPPDGFRRKTWTMGTAFGPDPLWGDWRAAPGLDAEGRRVLERLRAHLDLKLGRYGTGPDRFGLIHADLRLANLLETEERLGVIDFDDCGFSWFGYDFAAAISFLETEPYIGELRAAWLRGYRSVAPFAALHEEMLPTLVLFRRLLLTAWIGSHSETRTAREAGLGAFTAGTVALARGYLEGEGA